MSLHSTLKEFITTKVVRNIISGYTEEMCSQCTRDTSSGEYCTGFCKKWLCSRCELNNWCNYRLNNECYYCMRSRLKNSK